jgi:Flp pilus assembly protein TadD
MLNTPGVGTAGDMIDALIAQDVQVRLEAFHTALERDSFANQEVVEQLAQQAMTISRNQNIPQQDRANFVQRAELELLKLVDEKPGDARLHNFLATFYRAIGAVEQSREQAAIATALSPEKPALIIEQAVIELQANELEAGLAFLQKAFELEEKNTQARVLYAAVLMRTGSAEEAKALILEDETYVTQFALNDYALSATQAVGDFAFLATLFEVKVEREPTNAQHRASLAFVYYQLEDIEKSVAVLTQAGEEIDTFKPTAQCYVANLEAGNSPEAGCN